MGFKKCPLSSLAAKCVGCDRGVAQSGESGPRYVVQMQGLNAAFLVTWPINIDAPTSS